jgi:hypothetical protein
MERRQREGGAGLAGVFFFSIIRFSSPPVAAAAAKSGENEKFGGT